MNEPVHGLSVVDVIEIAELRTEHLLGEQFAEELSGAGRDVGNGEVVAQEEVEVYVVLPLGAAAEGVCLHGSQLKQRRQAEVCLELGGRLYGEGVLEEGQLDIVDDEVHLLGDAAGDGVGERRGRNLVKVAFVVDGRGFKQVKVDAAAVAEVEGDGRSSHKVVLAAELRQQR